MLVAARIAGKIVIAKFDESLRERIGRERGTAKVVSHRA